MSSESDHPPSSASSFGLKPVRRSPRLSPQGGTDQRDKHRKKVANLQEVKKKGRMSKSHKERDEELQVQLQKLDLSRRSSASGTGLVYSETFTRHQNLWDSNHPESPDRVTTIMEELDRQELLSRCIRVEPRSATDEELLLVHTKQYIDLIKSTQKMSETELRLLSDKYDSIYIHPETFQVSILAVGSVLQLVDQVLTSELRNGFAVIRPPGHHAQSNEANGFCIFNNVAIAARYAQNKHRVKRVLIVDWDVHHGQGIQYAFQEDPSVLYMSVHRFEQGAFWPHLPESDNTFVGCAPAEGRNINLAWTTAGKSDADYVCAFQQLLLPVAYEFQPELVLVSAGFDAALGDPKVRQGRSGNGSGLVTSLLGCHLRVGQMCVSPECFQTLTRMLMSLAEGRLILALEGGYNLQSTAEGSSACVRALLGEACAPMTPSTAPSDCALKSISETVSALYPYWTSLQVLEGDGLAEGCVLRETTPSESPQIPAVTKTGLVYDERMMEHLNLWDRHHPEQPQRIFKIFSRHQQLGLVERCLRIPARFATEEELAMCHTVAHIQQMKSTSTMKSKDLYKLGQEFNSIFINSQSYQSALLAAGSCFNAVDQILTGQVRSGVAIVRPPGHHAESDSACGFCFFNTAALAARYAQKISEHAHLRVLMLDWDVHHGNGTQHMFEDDNSVLYISLHRYDNGTFFPSSEDASPDRVGVAQGKGFNVNVAWSGGRMGDADYLAAFHQVVMPIATEFNPSLVLVSAGFDAARGDPLGGYHVTPEGYAHLTHMLMSLACGRVLLILEGGYNLTSISDSMAMCTSMLLGDPPPFLAMPLLPPHHAAVTSINEVIRHHAPYWKSLRIKIPESVRAAVTSRSPHRRRSGKGKDRKSRLSGPDKPTMGMEGTPADHSLDQLTQGLASLDINQSTHGSEVEAASEKTQSRATSGESSTQQSQSEESSQPPAVIVDAQAVVDLGDELEPAGACGWSKPQEILELTCGVQMAPMYVVDPLSSCPHLDAVKPLPPSGIDVFLPCHDCGSEVENWICLTCYKVACGRYVNEHMLAHGETSHHPMVLSFCDLSVWCYVCEAYVHNQAVFEAKNAAHSAKFGEEIPPWS
ncbi:histone deacetylase 6 isoform X2 [Syngnathoides biaculeatus]|uniref:histone deacetylase 6 isoform X2 n=1 Tax=Syngnathoides biaculeatus TaxID=300417 RepID=UPI002ADDC305|nr:histone deacetylase 6 isoform X2 [Syngnathoides biaculeatus]